jgi:hypothetical protein
MRENDIEVLGVSGMSLLEYDPARHLRRQLKGYGRIMSQRVCAWRIATLRANFAGKKLRRFGLPPGKLIDAIIIDAGNRTIIRGGFAGSWRCSLTDEETFILQTLATQGIGPLAK